MKWVSNQTRVDTSPQPPYLAIKAVKNGCLFDNLTDEQRKQPYGLACSCPKCTPRS